MANMDTLDCLKFIYDSSDLFDIYPGDCLMKIYAAKYTQSQNAKMM